MKKSHSNLFLLALLATNASAQNHTHQGGSKYGNVVWTISGSIPTPLLIFLLY